MMMFGRLGLFFLSLFTALQAHAAGGISHIYMARQAAMRVQHADLQSILKTFDGAYAVGSNYPDTGYLKGTHYGEDSHWDPFIFAFADLLKQRYEHPERDNPKLVAFLMGCATHRVSDELFHWRLLNLVAQNDFGGDWEAAHKYADTGLDLLLTVDKNQWFTHPGKWYVPVRDLVEVYKRMGLNTPSKEIIFGNSIYYFAGFGERFLVPFKYRSKKARAPWAAANYDSSSEGGYAMTAQSTAEYLDALWVYLVNKNAPRPYIPTYSAYHAPHLTDVRESVDLAVQAKALGLADIPIVEQVDGSVELQAPIFYDRDAYGALLNALGD